MWVAARGLRWPYSEPHRPGAQVGLVQLLLGRILVVGAADDEAVGRELREVAAEEVVELEAWPFHCARSPPRTGGIALALHQRLAPEVAGLGVVDAVGSDADLGEHRIDDRLPAGAAQEDGLALDLLDVRRLSPWRKAKSNTS